MVYLQAIETHAHDAVSAALEMLRFMEKWQSDNPVLGPKGLSLRIGLNSGSVIARVVGKKKSQYDIWGETINLARGWRLRVKLEKSIYPKAPSIW